MNIAVAAVLHDKAVEGHIGGNHAVVVLFDNAVCKLVGKPFKLGDKLSTCSLGAEGGCLALYRSTDIVEVDHIAKTEVNDIVAAGVRL